MKIRMLGGNCKCWKAGDVFKVRRTKQGYLYIYCRDTKYDGRHDLLDENYDAITNIRKLADDHEVIT